MYVYMFESSFHMQQYFQQMCTLRHVIVILFFFRLSIENDAFYGNAKMLAFISHISRAVNIFS